MFLWTEMEGKYLIFEWFHSYIWVKISWSFQNKLNDFLIKKCFEQKALEQKLWRLSVSSIRTNFGTFEFQNETGNNGITNLTKTTKKSQIIHFFHHLNRSGIKLFAKLYKMSAYQWMPVVRSVSLCELSLRRTIRSSFFEMSVEVKSSQLLILCDHLHKML